MKATILIFFCLFCSGCLHTFPEEPSFQFTNDSAKGIAQSLLNSREKIIETGGHAHFVGPVDHSFFIRSEEVKEQTTTALNEFLNWLDQEKGTHKPDPEVLKIWTQTIENKPQVTPESEAVLRSKLRNYTLRCVKLIDHWLLQIHKWEKNSRVV